MANVTDVMHTQQDSAVERKSNVNYRTHYECIRKCADNAKRCIENEKRA